MNYARAVRRVTRTPTRPLYDPPIKRGYSLANAVIFNFSAIANRDDAFDALLRKFGDKMIVIEENHRRGMVEIAIQFTADTNIHDIVEEGFSIGDKSVPVHLLFDLA